MHKIIILVPYLAYFVHTNTLQLMKVVTLTIVITHYLILHDLRLVHFDFDMFSFSDLITSP